MLDIGKASLFVVEDEILVARDLRTSLEDLGYAVVGTATSGEEALAKVPLLHPDLILMDIRLEGELDGIQTAEIIRRRWRIPTLYLTARSDIETLQRAKQTRPLGFLTKPLRSQDLQATIEMALMRPPCSPEAVYRWDPLFFVLNTLEEAVVVVNNLNQITHTNPAADLALGASHERVDGQAAEVILPLPAHICSWDTILNSPGPMLLPPEFSCLMRSGRHLHLHQARAIPLQDEEGSPQGAMLIWDPQVPNSQLIHAFVETISHELKTPLTAMKMALHLLKVARHNSPHSEPSPTDQRYLGILDKELEKEIELVNSLLDFERLEYLAAPLEIQFLDLYPWLLQHLQLWEARVATANLTLTWDLPGSLPAIQTDPSHLERILNELLTNACRFSPAENRFMCN
ncbi:MAG: hybrid sensor histidine kinase/response regulator [Synechococcaceae cyanobacterium SM2_3_1]|nr:hybrid sensor histidine kinase/response regulator [Synechococcaceae cyanobacterium SM2_3_1]